jgi:hypothetical protein
MKTKVNSDRAGIGLLIETYFEGLTTLEEEQALRDYFQGENVSEELEIYKPMFRYFSREISGSDFVQPALDSKQTPKRRRSILRWVSVAAAASLLLLFSLKLTFSTHKTLPETSQVYIDGKKYTNVALIRTEALKALENLSEDNEDVYSSQIEALNFFLENN